MTALDFILQTHLHQIIGGLLLGGAGMMASKVARKVIGSMRRGYLDVSATTVKIPIIKFHKTEECDDWLRRFDEYFKDYTDMGMLRNITVESIAPIPGSMDQYLFRFVRREWNSYYHPEGVKLDVHDLDIKKHADDGYTMHYSAQQYRRSFFGYDLRVMSIIREWGFMPSYADTHVLSFVFNMLDKKLDVDTLHTLAAKISKHIPVFLTYVDVDGTNMAVEQFAFIGKFKILLFVNGRCATVYYPGNDYFNEINQFENLVRCLGLFEAAERLSIAVAFRYDKNLYWNDHKASYEKLQEQKGHGGGDKSMFKINICKDNSNSRVIGERRQCNHKHPDGRDAIIKDGDRYFCKICGEAVTPPASNSAFLNLMASTREAIARGREEYEKQQARVIEEADFPAPPDGFAGSVGDWIVTIAGELRQQMAQSGTARLDKAVLVPLSRNIKNSLRNKGYICVAVNSMIEISGQIYNGKATYGDVYWFKGGDIMFMVVPYDKAYYFDVHFARKYFYETPSRPFTDDFDICLYKPTSNFSNRDDLNFTVAKVSPNIEIPRRFTYYYYREWWFDNDLNPGDVIMWAPLGTCYKVTMGNQYYAINQELGIENSRKFHLELIGDTPDCDAMFERGELERHPKQRVYRIGLTNDWIYLHNLKVGDMIIDKYESIFRIVSRETAY